MKISCLEPISWCCAGVPERLLRLVILQLMTVLGSVLSPLALGSLLPTHPASILCATSALLVGCVVYTLVLLPRPGGEGRPGGRSGLGEPLIDGTSGVAMLSPGYGVFFLFLYVRFDDANQML